VLTHAESRGGVDTFMVLGVPWEHEWLVPMLPLTSRSQVALGNALFRPSCAWAPLIPLYQGGVRGDLQVSGDYKI
jgi:hypothetical protein